MADFPIDDIPSVDEDHDPMEIVEGARSDTADGNQHLPDTWTVYTDGSHNRKGSGIGCLIISPDGEKFEKAVRLNFPASNNVAEYEAAICALRSTSELGATKVKLYTDSKLVANQFGGQFEAKDDRMKAYLDTFHKWAAKFAVIEVIHLPRAEVRHADSLAYLAAAIESKDERFVQIFVQEKPCIDIPIDEFTKMYINAVIFLSGTEYNNGMLQAIVHTVGTKTRLF